MGVSVHTTWIAAAAFTVLGLVVAGPAAVARLRGPDMLAVGYLAVAVTALAFVLWYSSVARLGPGRAGLLTGVAPVAAAAAGTALGAPALRPLVWLGIAVVAAGLALGLPTSRRPGSGNPRPCCDAYPPSRRWAHQPLCRGSSSATLPHGRIPPAGGPPPGPPVQRRLDRQAIPVAAFAVARSPIVAEAMHEAAVGDVETLITTPRLPHDRPVRRTPILMRDPARRLPMSWARDRLVR